MRPAGRWRFDIRQAGRRLLAGYLAVLAVNALAYFALVRPRENALRELIAESGPGEERVGEREAEVRAREAFQGALEKATQDLEGLRTGVLSTRERRMIDVQLELARISKQFGINLQRVQYENQKLEDGAVERFAMVVPLEGGYQNLRRFLRAVEDSDKFLVIEQVGLATAQDGGSLVELHITLATYFVDEAFLERPIPRRKGARRA